MLVLSLFKNQSKLESVLHADRIQFRYIFILISEAFFGVASCKALVYMFNRVRE